MILMILFYYYLKLTLRRLVDLDGKEASNEWFHLNLKGKKIIGLMVIRFGCQKLQPYLQLRFSHLPKQYLVLLSHYQIMLIRQSLYQLLDLNLGNLNHSNKESCYLDEILAC